MHTLLVTSDPMIARPAERALKRAAFKCFTVDRGEDAAEMTGIVSYDLIILDSNLPDMSGLNLLRFLREAGVSCPVLLLSNADDIEGTLEGFGNGADDQLQKPFHDREMVARCHALIRRSRGRAGSHVRIDKLEMDLTNKEVRISGEPLGLTPREYDILELLVTRRGVPLTNDAILNALYEDSEEPESRIAESYVCRLRRKLSKATGGPSYIKTIRGVGYVVDEED